MPVARTKQQTINQPNGAHPLYRRGYVTWRQSTTASALRDPLDEMMSSDTRENVIAMANAVRNNMAVSGYKIAVPMLLQAWHAGGKCTEHGADA